MRLRPRGSSVLWWGPTPSTFARVLRAPLGVGWRLLGLVPRVWVTAFWKACGRSRHGVWRQRLKPSPKVERAESGHWDADCELPPPQHTHPGATQLEVHGYAGLGMARVGTQTKQGGPELGAGLVPTRCAAWDSGAQGSPRTTRHEWRASKRAGERTDSPVLGQRLQWPVLIGAEGQNPGFPTSGRRLPGRRGARLCAATVWPDGEVCAWHPESFQAWTLPRHAWSSGPFALETPPPLEGGAGGCEIALATAE
jgi:hypothetical protein